MWYRVKCEQKNYASINWGQKPVINIYISFFVCFDNPDSSAARQVSQVFIGGELPQCGEIPQPVPYFQENSRFFCVKADEISENIVQSAHTGRISRVSHLSFRKIPGLEIYLAHKGKEIASC